MKINGPRPGALIIVAILFPLFTAATAFAQGASAAATPQGPGATSPSHSPPRHRGNGHQLKRRAASPSRFISVLIISNPPGSQVTVEGEAQDSTDEEGGLELSLNPGSYEVVVSKPGYVSQSRRINVGACPPYEQDEEFNLEQALVSLHVKTYPNEAEVYLGSTYEGRSSADGTLTIENVNPTRPHELRAAKEGYAEGTTTVKPNQTEASITLKIDWRSLKVKTEPGEAEVYLDDVYKGRSGADGILIIEHVKADREHTLRGSVAGYPQQSLTLQPNYEEAVLKLAPASAASSPSPGQPLPRAQDDQGESAQPAGNKGAASVNPQKPDERQGVAAQKEDSAPPAQKDASALAKKEAEQGAPDKQATNSGTEPSTSLTPTRTQHQSSVAREQPPAITSAALPKTGAEARANPTLDETVEWLRRNFSAKFTYRYSEAQNNTSGGATLVREASVDIEPLHFQGCRLEWRIFNDTHSVSLSDLDPLNVRIQLRTTPGATYFTEVWNLVLASAEGKEAFEKIEGGSGDSKRYSRIGLPYDDKEKAENLAAAFKRAIELCGSKAEH